MRLLDELESGEIRDDDLPLGETLPTPVARLPREGDLPEEPTPAAIPPKPKHSRRHRGPTGGKRAPKAKR